MAARQKQTSLNNYFKTSGSTNKRKEEQPHHEEESEEEYEEDVGVSDKPTDCTEPAKKKQKTKRCFRAEWLEIYTWLRHETVGGVGKMYCTFCQKAGKLNGFTKGSTNIKRGAINEHAQSTDHVASVALRQQQNVMQEHCDKAKKSSSNQLLSQLKVVLHLAKNDIPCHQFGGMTVLLKSLQAPDFQNDAGLYKHSDSVNDMEKALEQTLLGELDEKLQASEFLGIIIDETVNITVTKKLIMYVKCERDGIPETCFLGNYDIQDGTAQCVFDKVVEALLERGVPIRRVTSLGSDGASVMTGKRGGVIALLKNKSPFAVQVHCVAHRCALAAVDACKAVGKVDAYKRTVNSVYSFYKHSATRTNRLREISANLDDEDMTSLKHHCAVRWLSLDRAVNAIKDNWPALVMELTEEADGGNAQAHGIVNQIQTYHFTAMTHMLCDVLPVMTKLNLVFQKEDVNLSNIRPMVQASVAALTQLKESPGAVEQLFNEGTSDGVFKKVKLTQTDQKFIHAFDSVREKYIQHLVDALKERFPENDLDILNCFDVVFNPTRYPKSSSKGE